MTSREIRKRRDRNQRIMWIIQDTLGLSLIALIVGGIGFLAWGIF